MPRNDTKYRSLRTDFREHLTRNGAWPIGFNYLLHMRENHGRISGNALTGLRKGRAEPEKAAFGLVTLLRGDEAPPGATEALFAYLEARGVRNPADLKASQILDVVTGPPRTRPTDDAPERDYLLEGVWAAQDLIRRPKRWIWRQSRECERAEIAVAVDWLQLYIAYTLTPVETRDSLTVEAARPIAESHMGITAEEYARRATAWHDRLPLTTRFGLGPRAPAGWTVVLPLTPEAYGEVRNGRRASYECGPEDLMAPSSHLLVEVVAERVASERVESTNPTLPLMASLHLQLARLSGIDSMEPGGRIHLLSFAGTKPSRDRLVKQGFKPTGAKMPRSGVAIMERTFTLNSLRGLEAATVIWLRWLDWAAKRL